MNTNQPVITMTDIHKSVPIGKRELEILKGVHLTVRQGEMLAIMGASGCGKSTLLNVIGCLDSFTSGTYLLKGESMADKSQRQLASIRSQHFGYVVQDFALITDATVWENITIPLDYSKKKMPRQEILSLLDNFGLKDMKKTRVSLLSGGEQQRVAIVRALVNQPDIILADEPTGSLDSETGSQVMDLLRQICDSGKTILIVTHDETIANRCDRILRMKDGVIITGSH